MVRGNLAIDTTTIITKMLPLRAKSSPLSLQQPKYKISAMLTVNTVNTIKRLHHPISKASRKSSSASDFYRDFFVWSSSSTSSSPPSALKWPNGKSIWSLDSVSGRFYLRSSVDESPLLNLASKAVRSEVEDVVDYWLSKGADGFSLRGLDHLALFENVGKFDAGKSDG